jgi:TolB protein
MSAFQKMRAALAGLLLLLGGLDLSWGDSAQEGGKETAKGDSSLEIDVFGPSTDLYKIAVVPPKGSASGSTQVADIAARDLMLSSLFKVLDSKSFVESETKPAGSIDESAWTVVGAQGVIKGKIAIAGTDFDLELNLFEVVKGGSPVLTKTYKGKLPELRGSVHNFVNLVVEHFTGVRGIFGSRILFARKTGKKRKDIFTVGMDGYGLAKRTDNGSINIIPSWGPGSVIFYTSFMTGFPYLYRTDRAEPVLKGEGLNMGAAVAPGGGRMAVVMSVNGQPDIFLTDIEGKIIKRLTNNSSIEVSPVWGPGGKLAFVSDMGGSPQIYVMGADGGGTKRVTFKGSYNTEPGWCPKCDQPQIVYSGRDGDGYDIFTVNVSTGQIKRLTEGQGSNSSPAWSPDGRLVAFYSSRGGIYIMNTDGLNQNLILKGHAETLRWR